MRTGIAIPVGYLDSPKSTLMGRRSVTERYGRAILSHHVLAYYDVMRRRLVSALKGLKASRVGVLGGAKIPRKGEHIVASELEFDRLQGGRTVEWHVASGPTTRLAVIDMEPGKRAARDFRAVRKVCAEVLSWARRQDILSNPRALYTGGRAFHVWADLPEETETKKAVGKVARLLADRFAQHDVIALSQRDMDPDAVGVWPRQAYGTGTHVAPWSIRASTGLCAVWVPSARLAKFSKRHAEIHRVYKQATGKRFPWEWKGGPTEDEVVAQFWRGRPEIGVWFKGAV